MKHKRLLLGSLFAGALTLGILTPSMSAVKEKLEPDNVEYGEKLEADFYKPDIKAAPKTRATKAASVSIHYHNDDGKCGIREFWIWCNGVDGSAFTPTVSADGKDMEISFNFAGEYEGFAGKDGIFFIVKYLKGTPEGGDNGWVGQSQNVEVKYEEKFEPDASGHIDIWTIPGEGNAIEVYNNQKDTTTDRFVSAAFSSWKTITVKATAAPKSYKLYALTSNYMNHSLSANLSDYLISEGGEQSGATFTVNLKYTAKINVQYLLEGIFTDDEGKEFVKQKYVACYPLYETERFNTYYIYNGDDLGSTYHDANSTTFKVWAPAAANVRVLLYESGSSEEYKNEKEDPKATNSISGGYNMSFRPGGVWELTIKNKDLKGMYYTYQVANSLGKTETIDPYAKACGVNGKRGMIVDWSETNPEGWDSVPLVWDGVDGYDINNPNDLSIYETHIRDLTMDETWNGTSMRGTYSAFAEKGTRYTEGSTTVTTGYDHIEEFGVKAIQLIPVFDNDNMEGVDERSYNWGYNPLNYNCLDGSYATNPYDGAARVKEFKSLVKAYSENANHTRIIMDVVYNHVSSIAQHCFTKLMPYYYFRYNEDNAPWDGSGCGNEVKTEAPMMSKYLVDSLCWWAKEYKIKGFRFDLMGLIDWKTIKKAAQELYKIDKDIYLYGEGWSLGCHIDEDKYDTWGADTWTVYNKLYRDGEMCYVGGFNNAGRDTIAGETGNVNEWGFITQGSDHVGGKSSTIADMLVGYHTGTGGNPNQCVNYSSCHDDFSTFDHLAYQLDNNQGINNIEIVCAAVSAVESTVMFSNGVAFIQGGQECFLSKEVSAEDLAKYGDERTASIKGKLVSSNSYRLSDYTNAIRWNRKISINGTNVFGYYEAIKNAVHTRNIIKKYSYEDLQTADPYSSTSKFNIWGQGDGSCSLGLYNDGYFFFVNGANDSLVNFGAIDEVSVVFSSNPADNGYQKITSPYVGMRMYWYTCICFKA